MKQLPYITPIRPVKRAKPFDDPEWLFDLKYDGYRAVLYRYDDICILRSKQDNRLPFPELERELARCLRGHEVILDGEVCSLDPGGWPRFDALLSRKGSIVYVAFDILWLHGRDLRDLPLSERKEILEKFIGKKITCMRTGFYVLEHGIKFYRLAKKLDLEGVIAKRLSSVYSKRTRWFKIKNPDYSQDLTRAKFFVRHYRRL